MGVLGAYLWYRKGKKKAERQARRIVANIEADLDEANERCDTCGHTRAQHSDEGDCPRYG